MNQYLVLLRGINVGGKNLIKMTELKSIFEKMGFEDVKTYIQSGNVIFSSKEDSKKLIVQIERVLFKYFKTEIKIALLSKKQIKSIITKAPKDFGLQADKYRYDVIFLKEPLRASSVIKQLTIKEGVDEIHHCTGAIYYRRLISKASQSHLSRLVKLPIYQDVTIRNWNTTTRLLKLMEET